MIPRYAKEVINRIFSDDFKTKGWQRVELAVIWAKAILKMVSWNIYEEISRTLKKIPIDLDVMKKLEKLLRHDLNAFLGERSEHLPPRLQRRFHERITSYDTEEAAFARMLKAAVKEVEKAYFQLLAVLKDMALRYRFTIMNGRTHGQEAEMQSFGVRCLTWYRELQEAYKFLKWAKRNLKYSKLSGAMGNYGGSLSPEMERLALKHLGFVPYYGATQIMPRSLYVPLACSLVVLAAVMQKIALDIRLGARSGRPIYQEPFEKTQTGSTAMPHKKNTILTEQIEGMSRMAKSRFMPLLENSITWEARAIEQSCVERVDWPDLFHIILHMFETMEKVLTGLVVYPDNMMQEIIESRGCYASGEAKEFLKEKTEKYNLPAEEAYRIVQLAAFNIFEVSPERKCYRDELNLNLAEADDWLKKFSIHFGLERAKEIPTIEHLIPRGELTITPQLDIKDEDVMRWNSMLKEIYSEPKTKEKWHRIFRPSFLLKNEAILYRKILGV